MTFDELTPAIAGICDSKPDVNQEGAGEVDAAWPLATMARVAGIPMRGPMQDRITGCDPIGTFDRRMTPEVRESISGLTLELFDVEVRWVESPQAGDDRPVLDIGYTLAVSTGLTDTADYFLEMSWSRMTGHVLLPFSAGGDHCSDGCWTNPLRGSRLS